MLRTALSVVFLATQSVSAAWTPPQSLEVRKTMPSEVRESTSLWLPDQATIGGIPMFSWDYLIALIEDLDALLYPVGTSSIHTDGSVADVQKNPQQVTAEKVARALISHHKASGPPIGLTEPECLLAASLSMNIVNLLADEPGIMIASVESELRSVSYQIYQEVLPGAGYAH